MANRPRKTLPKRIVVFGESDNDQEALRHLMHALRSDLPTIEKRRKPLVLVKGRTKVDANENIRRAAKVIKADGIRFDVRLVVAHQDCDDVEPAHQALAAEIEPGFTGWHCRFLEPKVDFLFMSIACEVQTGESVAGHRVKVGIRIFPSVSNLLDGIVSTHLANPG